MSDGWDEWGLMIQAAPLSDRAALYDLIFRREWPYFLAFDVLSIDGEDLRALPLVQRKRRLARIMPRIVSRLMCLHSIDAAVVGLFEFACERDLEGIVAKWSREPTSAMVAPRAG